MIALGVLVVVLVAALASALGLGASRRADPHAPGGGDGPGAGGRRSVGLLVAAAALVVVVVVLVVTVGIDRPPSLEPLAAGADGPDAAVAWLDHTGDGRSCVRIAGPDGAVTDLTCDVVADELVAWSDEGIVVRIWAEVEPRLTVLDPDTGEAVEFRLDVEEDPWMGAPDEGVWSRHEDGELVVRTADDEVLWRVDAPRTYHVSAAARSPDGMWVAAVDAASRLLVLPADGSSEPRVWAEDVDGWTRLVWQDVAG